MKQFGIKFSQSVFCNGDPYLNKLGTLAWASSYQSVKNNEFYGEI